MKTLVYLVILAGLAYGGKYLYDQGYFDSFMKSFSNTAERTGDFVTDKAVKETNY